MAPIIYSEKEIAARFNISVEEMDKATRVLDTTTGEIWYQVESRSGGPAHEVRYHKKYRKLTCSCAAGLKGIPCWAQRAAMASAFEYRQQENIQARKEAEEAARKAAEEEMKRLIARRDEWRANDFEGFSLLK